MLKNNTLSGYNIEYLAKVYKDYKLNGKQVPAELEEIFKQNQQEFDSYLQSKPLLEESSQEQGFISTSVNQTLFVNLAKRIIENHIKHVGFAYSYSYVFQENNKKDIKELSCEFYGLTKEDLAIKVDLKGYFGFTLISFKELFASLEDYFKGAINYSIFHLPNSEQEWFTKNIANGFNVSLNNEQKFSIFKNLVKSEGFEKFLATKFVGIKRFGADGLDSFIVFLQSLVNFANLNGVTDILTGMAHRGRLNALCNFTNKPLSNILAEFLGNVKEPTKGKSSDVKYHMGFRGINNNVNVEILPNPSHLEAVNPVVLGKLKAVHNERKESKSAFALLIHGDSAYITLGVNQETFTLKGLKGYDTKGTIHVILNNELGFTAQQGLDYPCNHNAWGAFLNSPVLHVHANEVEALHKVAKIAFDYKTKFNKDIFINIIGYRKFGHNEGDEPKFTNPLYYQNTANLKSYVELYKNQLINNGFTKQKLEDFIKENNTFMEQEFKKAKTLKVKTLNFNNSWEGFDIKKHESMQEQDTFYEHNKLLKLCQAICKEPADFNLNSKIKRQLKQREELIKEGNIDWAGAELLAYASLLQEGFNIRLSGEDAKRGTFSHRHACYFDQEDGKEYNLLKNLANIKGNFFVYNSTISELGVLGFDYGYSLQNPNNLTIWEAQFGDFANGGQVIIDQFISSAESKWFMLSNLVMLLPHGLEGQGPEHSSARLERFLQLCAQNNMLVAYPTTPANFFHLLRRQVKSYFKKPLIVMSPKSLLRHKSAISPLTYLSSLGLQKIILDNEKTTKVQKIIFCTGKIYYDLKEQKEKTKNNNVLIIRLEELYPFPYNELTKKLKNISFKNVLWVQEEHENSGAYYYVKDKLKSVLLNLNYNDKITYITRELSPSPAVGQLNLHNQQKQEILNKAFDI